MKDDCKYITLILFTDVFPHGINSETAFLGNEIQILLNSFQNVIVIPRTESYPKNSTENIKTEDLILEIYKLKTKPRLIFNALCNRNLYSALFYRNLSFWNGIRLKKLLYEFGLSKMIEIALMKYIKNLTGKIIFYSYWNNEVALASAMVARKDPNRIKAIARAHNHDLYEDYYDYIPTLNLNIKYLDKIFLISKEGMNYLTKRFPSKSDKFELSYLGVSKAENLPIKVERDYFVVVSCSYVERKKRVHLIYEALQAYLITNKVKIKWFHFGDGTEFSNLKKIVSHNCLENLEINLMRFVDNEALHSFYRSNYVDFFITTTENEGLPVSIQEAQSYGIPVLATAVNGIPEIVNNENGILIEKEYSINEILDAITSLLNNENLDKREMAYKTWEQYFNREKNDRYFLNKLTMIIYNG